ncbi:hypothetical protein F511_37564 [Dorcoceras hygrometricum]|uniref:Uncharacterized protein n=1 Tax=Dorcoceras hygrometricum TaxID=472368 RepID=A0A2Z7A441_9LAMI|nr:hypothetical protein F511_37564 [Dorcoceras hygrometricum]
MKFIGRLDDYLAGNSCLAPTSFSRKPALHGRLRIGYPRMSVRDESSTTMHRLLHASGSHPIPPPYDPKTNQYNQELGLIHSTNGNHLKSPNEGSSIDHRVTINLHAQNITMFPTNETRYFASQILVSTTKSRATQISHLNGRPNPTLMLTDYRREMSLDPLPANPKSTKELKQASALSSAQQQQISLRLLNAITQRLPMLTSEQISSQNSNSPDLIQGLKQNPIASSSTSTQS